MVATGAMGAPPPTPLVVTRESELEAVIDEVARAPRVAIDLEASGMHAYRAEPCTVQIAWGQPPRVVVVDALATSIAPLGPLLSAGGPTKILHDCGFDARLLAERGIELGNVRDTSIAARMLSRVATGLAALLETELGVRVSKAMQQHDWRVRPLDPRMLEYLAADVVHLDALEEKIWGQVTALGIEEAVLEETRHRIASSVAAARAGAAPPPYVRVKGASRLGARELAALRVLAELREREAERRDVPPHYVASADALIEAARARPAALEAFARIRGIGTSTQDGRAFAAAAVAALQTAPDDIPPTSGPTSNQRASRPTSSRRDALARRGSSRGAGRRRSAGASTSRSSCPGTASRTPSTPR